MKIKIYRLFTQDNNIILSPEALSCLEASIRDEESLRRLVMEYKRQGGPRVADLDMLRRILVSPGVGSPDGCMYRVTGQSFKETDHLGKYRFLRDRMEKAVIPIYLLGEGSPGTMFGCYYRNKGGEEVLEDDSGVVLLDTTKCTGDVFICENMFVGASGAMADGKFLVSEIHLPRVERRMVKKPDHAGKSQRILFFSDFRVNEMNSKVLERIVRRTSADMVVLMGRLCSGRSSTVPCHLLNRFGSKRHLAGTVPEILLCPDCDDQYPSLLPKKVSVKEEHRTLRTVTNPFTMEIGATTIGVIRDDIFRSKRNGRFFGKNHIDSFVRSILSQYSFNPFGLPNLSVDSLPDVFVVGQDFYPFVTTAEHVLFVSCPSFREEMAFVSYDLSTNTAQILNYKDLL